MSNKQTVKNAEKRQPLQNNFTLYQIQIKYMSFSCLRFRAFITMLIHPKKKQSKVKPLKSLGFQKNPQKKKKLHGQFLER